MLIFPDEAAAFGFLPHAAMILTVSFDFSPYIAAGAAGLCLFYCFVSCAFSKGITLENAASRLCAGIAALCYPGLFFGCLILMSRFAAATILLLTFLCSVMVNDAAAWFFGMLFGKKNRGLVAASPNKSAAGFIGGYAAAIGLCVGASSLYPAAFTAARFSALMSGVILGFATGFAATVGDLAESAIKRSCGVKDSGSLMPGRGGILDSIDSIAFAAPVFYLLYNALFILR